MSPIPKNVLKEMLADPAYKVCMKFGHFGHECSGKITFDHTVIFAGKQVQVKNFIISLCENGHSVNRFQDAGDHCKESSLWIALNRASEPEMLAISKAIPYLREKERLNKKWGVWRQIRANN